MGFTKKAGKILRFHDIEKEVPPRMRKEPKPGDNPLKRPYPPHKRDLDILDALLKYMPRDLPPESSKRDQRTCTTPCGVLYFHTLDIKNVKLCAKDFITGAPFSIYVEYECQGVIKCSYPVHSHKYSKIRIDHFVHFGAEVTDNPNDEDNELVIHVYAFQNPEKHWLIGSQILHLYEFIREIHGINTVSIQDDLNYYVGRVTFEFSWAYGSFGYGHSNQLRNTKNPVFDSVCHSMFPRIGLNNDDLIENKFRVRVPKRLRVVNLHSLLVRVPVGKEPTRKGKKKNEEKKQKDFNKEAKQLIFRRVKFSRGRPVHVALNLDIHQKFMENDFNQTYGEYICLRNRRERLQHLTRMMEGRLRDRYEYDTATGLFHPVKDVKDSRAALGIKKPLACPPGYLEHNLYPQTCARQQPVKLTGKDEQFISQITSAPRFSGYLATVFGYANPEENKGKKSNKKLNQVQPVEDCEFTVPPNAFLGGGGSETDAMTCFEKMKFYAKRTWYKILLFFGGIWEYIFPSATTQAEMLIPEISVTLPSPADSTTDFYAHCVQEKVYPKVTEVTAAKRTAISFVRAVRRKNVGEESESEKEKEKVRKEKDDPWVTESEAEDGEVDIRARDLRALHHVEKEKFGNPHQRPYKNPVVD